MKNFILVSALIMATSIYCMDDPKPNDSTQQTNTLLGRVDNDAFSKLIDLLEKEGVYVGPHIHDVACEQPDHGPAQPHMPSEAETKERNRDEKKQLTQLAQQMVAEHRDLNSFIWFDWEENITLLSAAANHKCRQNVLQIALANNADPNKANKDGTTPLQKATIAYCAANVSYLLSHGAKFDFANKDKTLLSRICSPACDEITPKSTRKRVATIKALITAGADPNTTELHFKKIQFIPNVLSGLLCHFMVRTKLLEKGPEYHERYQTFLDQRKQMISVLLTAGLNPFKKDVTGKTDWENIVAHKDNYDERLFNFAQEEIQKRQVKS